MPAWAPGFSAFGCASAEFEYRYDKSLDIAIAPDAPGEERAAASRTLQVAWAKLAERVSDEFRRSGFSPEDVTLRPGFRMQYRGQLNDLEIESPLASATSAEDWERLVTAFEETYARVYARAARSPELGIGVTGAIMRGTVPSAKPRIPEEPLSAERPPRAAFAGTRSVYRRGRMLTADIWEMEALKAGNLVRGPAILESPATTFVVPDGYETYLDAHRLFHLRTRD